MTVLEVGSENSTCLIDEEASSGSEENFPSYEETKESIFNSAREQLIDELPTMFSLG